ncbi:mechanosensitive ion channel family protein, partial [Bacteroidota bacterium]
EYLLTLKKMEDIRNIITGIAGESSWFQIGILVFSLILIWIVGKILKVTIKRLSKKQFERNNSNYAVFLNATASSITFVLISFGILIGFKSFDISEKYLNIITTISEVLVTLAIGYYILLLVDVPSNWFESLIDKSEKKLNKMFIPVIKKSLQVLVVIFIIIQIVQIVLDKPAVSIIAGLGIGGLAVALAAQDTLKHFIGSFVLAGDLPFEVGDRVVIDGHDGPVESMGLRSTRIRTLEGHLITIPNGELANKTIQNIGKRPYIRKINNITITYDTSREKVERAIEILKELLENHEGMNPEYPPRVFFNNFNADSLNIRAIYWYFPPNYWEYMDFTQRVNLEIYRRFNEEGIDFAFPTQTIFVAGDSKRPVNIGLMNKKKTN